ncbi:MAG: type II toxin-antitoxin system death-on-curing family toxin [bacterium]|nr:type II toxin-antitoxin system death-on-curing family toxin [bacterium]
MELPPLTVAEAEAIHAAVMEEYAVEPADEYTQAATLLWGVIRSHPFVQGNKRTASVLAFFFLERAGYRVEAREQAVLDLVNGVNEGKVTVEAAAAWFRRYTVPPAE